MKRLLKFTDEHLNKLEGQIAESGILILGDCDELPWVDGCIYLGRDKNAPHLLMSVNHCPSVPSSLLDQAIFNKFEQPVAMIPNQHAILPIVYARRISRCKLEGMSF
ncbi:MAG: hypothetical protein JKY54_18485 [Flavobacteriales bacterium]|nr:hypothetical protein [Flavobacteriales bacterium]